MKKFMIILIVLIGLSVALGTPSPSYARVSFSVNLGVPVVYPYPDVYAFPPQPVYVEPYRYRFYPADSYYPAYNRVIVAGKHHRYVRYYGSPYYFHY